MPDPSSCSGKLKIHCQKTEEIDNYTADMNGDHARRETFLTHLAECEAILRAFIAGSLPDAEERADSFQEVVLVLWRQFDRYDAGRPFRPWALGVAVRRMKEEYRHRRRRAQCLSAENLERLAAALEQRAAPNISDEEAALAECLNTLPPQSARLVQQRYFDGTGIDVIAAETGQNPAAVYQMLSRVRRRLAECIRRRLRREQDQPDAIYEIRS